MRCDGMLIQLKTGEWVNPEHVVYISDMGPFTNINLTGGRFLQVLADTDEEAEAYRDELAAQINAALR